MAEAGISTGRHSSTSSDQSIDPNDKYSVFRAVDQSGAIDVTSSSSMDSQDRLGAFHSHDQPVAKPGPQPSHLPLLHSGVSQPSSGWGQTEVRNVGGSSILTQQQNFGQLQSTASQDTEEVRCKLCSCKGMRLHADKQGVIQVTTHVIAFDEGERFLFSFRLCDRMGLR